MSRTMKDYTRRQDKKRKPSWERPCYKGSAIGPFQDLYPWMIWRGFRFVPVGHEYGKPKHSIVKLRVSGDAMHPQSRRFRPEDHKERMIEASWRSATGSQRDPWHQLFPASMETIIAQRGVKLRNSSIIDAIRQEQATPGKVAWINIRRLAYEQVESTRNGERFLSEPLPLFTSLDFGRWLVNLVSMPKPAKNQLLSSLGSTYGMHIAADQHGACWMLDVLLMAHKDYVFGKYMPGGLGDMVNHLFDTGPATPGGSVPEEHFASSLHWYFPLLG